MYEQVILSKEQAREIAFDLYDLVIRGIKEADEKKKEKEAVEKDTQSVA